MQDIRDKCLDNLGITEFLNTNLRVPPAMVNSGRYLPTQRWDLCGSYKSKPTQYSRTILEKLCITVTTVKAFSGFCAGTIITAI
jgi:hypothetical protein